MLDAVVIGAGFGGLGAALRLAELGKDVVVCEALRYPGGCASTFSRGGERWQAGATLASGLEEGGYFQKALARHDVEVGATLLEPVVDFRWEAASVQVTSRREEVIEQLVALPGAPEEAIRRFMRRQERVAEAMWPLLSNPSMLPPLSAASIAQHLKRAGKYLPLVPWAGRPLSAVLRHDGLEGWAPLKTWLDAACQITVQLPSDRAEAPIALAAIDYFFRGACHVKGGIGALAEGMVQAVERAGGQVRLGNRVKSMTQDGDGWLVQTREGTLKARHVFANVLPGALMKLTGQQSKRLQGLNSSVSEGWGAAMLYVLAEPSDVVKPAKHWQLIADSQAPLQEGNHIFCSVSDMGDSGLLPVTVSTHVRLDISPEQRPAYVAKVQQTMRDTLQARLPELKIVSEMTASPRTFERFTGRPQGAVGGIPRAYGWKNYADVFPRPALPGVYLVGDSVFPGQSALAAALGGHRAVSAALGRP